MAYYTPEQVAKAKEWDLLTCLQVFEPGELKKCGTNEYCTRTHDSLKISNGKRNWHSRGIGGRTALEYLIKIRGLDFLGAMNVLCGQAAPPEPKQPIPKKKPVFILPAACRVPSRAVAYLQSRGIDPDVIGACIQARILYESCKYHNCVFVGRDKAGKARSAFLRGTFGDFKQEAAGSEKAFSFFLPAKDPESRRLAVAEGAIDALSLASLVKMGGDSWQDCHYLSLGGTAPAALLQFLRDHPSVTESSLCLDNDKAGLEGIDRLTAAIRKEPELSGRIALIYPNPPPKEYGKDYNLYLTAQMKQRKVQREKQAPPKGAER